MLDECNGRVYCQWEMVSASDHIAGYSVSAASGSASILVGAGSASAGTAGWPRISPATPPRSDANPSGASSVSRVPSSVREHKEHVDEPDNAGLAAAA